MSDATEDTAKPPRKRRRRPSRRKQPSATPAPPSETATAETAQEGTASSSSVAQTDRPLRIAFASSEVAPFAKTGGLADVAGALPAALGERGHDVRVFMPLYSSIRFRDRPVHPVDFLHHVPIRLGAQTFHFSVFTAKLPGSEVDVYFVGCPALYDRTGVYTGEWDEHLRYALFQRAVLESCQRMGWGPHILHCNDWHTALLPLYLRTLYAWDRLFAPTRTVLTIHNIAYQGKFPADIVPNLGLAEFRGSLHQDHLRAGFVSFLETGILHADVVTTVSRTYAREIQTPHFGEGLDGLLRQRTSTVGGIVNGIDPQVWNPAVDEYLPQTYGLESVDEGKATCRAHLLRELGLEPAGDRVPVIGVVSRLTSQKGLELTMETMPQVLRHLDVRYVVLGSGERGIEEHFHWLDRTFPGKMRFFRGYNEPLAHRIEAGADIFLMPSLFEPCGLNQMYSQAYGTVPIVRHTGGLADTVEPFDRRTGRGTGFVFEHADTTGFEWALRTALETWQDPDAWRQLRRNGMERDFSWQRRVGDYEGLYDLLLR